EIAREVEREEVPGETSGREETTVRLWSRDNLGRLQKADTMDPQARGPITSQFSGAIGQAAHSIPLDKGKGVALPYQPQGAARAHADPPMAFVPPQYLSGMVGSMPPTMPSGSQPPSSLATIKEELQNYVRDVIAASVAAPKAKSVVDYCKLP